MNPMVSIIIPTYNRANLIGETLDSIRQQTYTNWECIIVDDGSTDDTERIVGEYIQNDSRFSFHKRPENRPKGANACRNYGFELAKGTYVNWFDSDDQMHPKKLEVQLKKLSEHQSANYCICQTEVYDLLNDNSLGLRSPKIESGNRFEDYICYKIFWLTTSPLWRTKFIINSKLRFDETLMQSQEYDFHIKALAIDSNYVVENAVLVKMVIHEENLSNNWMKNDHKVLSNVKVKQRTIENYHDRLTFTTQLKVLEMVTLVFKNLVLEKRFYLAQKVLKILKNMLPFVKVGSLRKKQFYFRANLMIWSYRIFGKGYNLLKPLHA
ncbi:glycosyltransferase family 2 protein [Hanstruepera marina]|uniref:glycosyltransferase family 2 protein n=1 Tax=Hanstruepera marina TaxID=2873265 RepID=UPI001CA70073|nr:glycosyltransferase family 2 protein [Hanstruepera marina]